MEDIHYNVKDVLGHGEVLCNSRPAFLFHTTTLTNHVTCKDCLALIERRVKFRKDHNKELTELKFHIF